MAEFALVAPLLLLLIAGIAQLLLLVQAFFWCQFAAYRAARVFAVEIQKGEGQGLRQARESALQSLGACIPRPESELSVAWDGSDPSWFKLTVRIGYPLLFSSHKARFSATSLMQAEDGPAFQRAHP